MNKFTTTYSIAIATFVLISMASPAESQDSSLLRAIPPRPATPVQNGLQPGVFQPGQIEQTGPAASPVGGNQNQPLMLDRVSWTHQPAPAIRTYSKNDVVTIRVDEITRVMAEGSAESRKISLYQAVLTDWISLRDFRLRPDQQANGDPAVGTQSINNNRAESTVESRESMTFNIAATVVDIRPNGLLVLEARKQIRVNDNLWETSLTGICRGQDIAPDNVVLSKDLIDLEIRKDDRGHLRDGYKRGWFQRWFDRVQPF
ncbi:Flagellar L-ring protein precursor [Rubripirellula obstinata]|uniref:Flagellar L-ring protein n=1 Tax=Rubripirellula obstinata TaxID=406547 RepID=A0A5B1CIH3_9BACT|nr:flagellar basal body L-ring protein FlgH [Rubripirellula obstinata]KAA1259519.1 Flagellar L-ring protein precursor [Rubripirellula obstinata]